MACRETNLKDKECRVCEMVIPSRSDVLMPVCSIPTGDNHDFSIGIPIDHDCMCDISAWEKHEIMTSVTDHLMQHPFKISNDLVKFMWEMGHYIKYENLIPQLEKLLLDRTRMQDDSIRRKVASWLEFAKMCHTHRIEEAAADADFTRMICGGGGGGSTGNPTDELNSSFNENMKI
jgi:hypothetical protein